MPGLATLATGDTGKASSMKEKKSRPQRVADMAFHLRARALEAESAAALYNRSTHRCDQRDLRCDAGQIHKFVGAMGVATDGTHAVNGGDVQGRGEIAV